MRRYYTIFCCFFSLVRLAAQTTEFELENKYWNYRDRLIKDFVQIGNKPGQSNKVIEQSDDSASVKKDNNYVYLELLGNSFIYGINYERILNSVCKYTLASSIGYAFSSSKLGTFNDVVIPLEIKMYNRIDKKNHFEFGLGTTYYYDKDRPANIVDGIEQKVNKHRTLLFGRVGYRYSSDNGFLFRVGFTPFYLPTSDDKIIPFGGISFGLKLH